MEPFTFLLQWHVTARCDQHCKHCYVFDEPTYVSESNNPLSYEDCVKVIDDYAEMLDRWKIAKKINFSGGDPLLREDIFDLLRYAVKKDIQIGILGNPYHVDHTSAKLLKKIGLDYFQISIDGLEQIHDYLRKQGSFEASIKAIRTLKDVGVTTGVMFTLSKLNSGDLIEVIKLCAKEHVDFFGFARVAPFGSGKNLKESLLKPKEYKNLLFEALEEFRLLQEAGSQTTFTQKDHLWALLNKELGLFKPLPEDNKTVYGGCQMGISFMTILADGTVYACRRFSSKIGKVPEQKLANIFLYSRKLNEYRDIRKYEKCSKCELVQFCRGCPAVAYGISGGNCFSSDPQCWKKF